MVNLVRNVSKHDLGDNLDWRHCARIGRKDLPLSAHQSLPGFGGYRHGCDGLVSHGTVPYRNERLLDVENPVYCDPTYSYVGLDCPRLPGKSWTRVHGPWKAMAAGIGGVATVDGQDRETERP